MKLTEEIKKLLNSSEGINVLVKRDIHSFTYRAFTHLNPDADYESNWHIQLIMETLEKVREGQIKRLIINMPPRSLKSICCSVVFPAWLLGHDPAKRIITTSYSLQLAKKHSLDTRALLTSEWYQKTFPNTQIVKDQNDKLKFQTPQFGFRLASSVGGTLTGEGGDIIILDDPINAMQASQPAMRKKVNDWYQQTLVSRLNNKKDGAIILVMQRFHPDDLSGYLLKTGGWDQLILPLVATKKERYFILGKNKLRAVGEPLHINRDTPAYIEQLKQEIGSYAFEAQYQQNPIITKASMIQPDWFGKYEHSTASGEPKKHLPVYGGAGGEALEINNASPLNPPASGGKDGAQSVDCASHERAKHRSMGESVGETGNNQIVQSWDTAIKSAPDSDYSVCITAKLIDGQSYILDIVRERLEYPELKKRLISHAARFSPAHILIEDKASGQQLIQDLRREAHLPIIPIMPKGDKFSRISAASGMIESGKVLLPERASWLGDFLSEVSHYPSSDHDDQLDALAQYLNWLRQKPKDLLAIRKL